MLANSLQFLFMLLIFKCSFSFQQSSNCTSVVVVTNANSGDQNQKVSNFSSSSEECKQHCLYDSINCKMATWNKNNNLCSIYSGISSNVSTLEDSEIYFISQVNSCESTSVCNNLRANEWSPIESVASLKRMALTLINATDIARCAAENFKNDFVFDFFSSQKCFQITGYGINNTTFSKQTYIYLKNPIFFSRCSVESKRLSIPTPLPNYTASFPSPTPTSTPTPPTSESNSTLSPFQAQMLRWDYKPLALRPAYVVLVGLGGACLLMTSVAVLALCQGKLGGGGGTSRKMTYSEGSTEPVEIHNHAYEDDSKIPEESVDLTLPHQEEYFDRTEVMD